MSNQKPSIQQTLLSTITQTTAAGMNKQGFRSFNDLVDFGEFPVDQKIDRMTKVEVWAGDRVNGIKATYKIHNGKSASQLRGRNEGTENSFEMKDGHYLVGIFGRRDSEGNIGSLSFVVFEADNGRVKVHGPWGNPPQAGKSFGTFGNVLAFAGTDENSFGLCSLSVMKDSNQIGPLL